MKQTKTVKNTQAVFLILITGIVAFTIFIIAYLSSGYSIAIPTYAATYEELEDNVEATNSRQQETDKIKELTQNQSQTWNIFNTIKNNITPKVTEEITCEEEDLEYTTIYKPNKDLPKGMLQVVQEGRDGRQQVITKKYYEDGILVNEIIDNRILVASLDKIVEIGAGGYSSNYKVKVGDTLYVTSSSLAVRVSPEKNAGKIITIDKNEKVRVLEIQNGWYKIKYNTYEGYIPSDCVTYIDPNASKQQYSPGKSKSQLLSTLSKNMDLRNPSGLSLDQFKKVLSNNSQDKNKIFEENAEYFYYIERQYNINGIFVAAVGIHESAWGTSKIAINKKNIFGYGASDSNPYGNAKTFTNYSEGIDLIARVLVKYYLNSPGTSIYEGQTANGSYYNGSTLNGVNQKYATDKNWQNGVYNWMSYLYNKL